jgi:hypothetical protein
MEVLLIPDNEPDAGTYATVKDIEKMLTPYMSPANLYHALFTLQEDGWVAIKGEDGFMLRFSLVGEGLYDIMLKESDPDVC